MRRPGDTAGKLLSAGGAVDISRRRSRRYCAGRESRPERSRDKPGFANQSESGVPAGTRNVYFDLSRWLRCALHHRLSSVAPPGRKLTSRSLPAVSPVSPGSRAPKAVAISILGNNWFTFDPCRLKAELQTLFSGNKQINAHFRPFASPFFS